MTIIARSKSHLGILLDAYADGFARSLPEDLGRDLMETGRAVQRRLEDEHEARARDAASPHFTEAGRHARAAERAQIIAREVLAKVVEPKATAYEARAQRVRDAALTGPAPAADATAIRRDLREREVRDLARAQDPTAVRLDYLRACREGGNDELIAAVEHAPTGFALVPEAVVAEGRAARAERLAPEAGPLAALAGELRGFIQRARQELGLAPELLTPR